MSSMNVQYLTDTAQQLTEDRRLDHFQWMPVIQIQINSIYLSTASTVVS